MCPLKKIVSSWKHKDPHTALITLKRCFFKEMVGSIRMTPISEAQKWTPKYRNNLNQNYKYSLSDRNKMFIFLVKFCCL